MGLVNGVWLAVLGLLGAANLVIAKKPDAAQLIEKLAPYQGWIGAVSALWGVWGIISSVLNLGLLSIAPILWISLLADSVLLFSLGLLLGIGVLKTFIKAEEAQAKMDQLIVKLAPKQGVLGLISIGVGAWMIVAGFVFSAG
jgi:hypothetical protein